jgi:hypothetical protein
MSAKYVYIYIYTYLQENREDQRGRVLADDTTVDAPGAVGSRAADKLPDALL